MIYFSRFEWEGLQKKYVLGKYGPIKSELLPEGTKSFEMYRDDKYQLIGIISGEFDDLSELKILSDRNIGNPGEFVETWNLKISDPSTKVLPKDDLQINYEINGIKGNLRYWQDINGKYFEYDFFMESIKRDFNNSSEVESVTEWFLNGPYGHVYPKVSHYELKKLFGKKRDYKDFKYEVMSGGRSTHDYFKVEFHLKDDNERCFVIHSVPDEFLPAWSKKVGIEYMAEWGIPDSNEREKISEIVSFLFGRQLVKIGSTDFGNDIWRKGDMAYNPKIPSNIDLIALCRNHDMSPIDIDYMSKFISDKFKGPFKSSEDNFNELIPKYIKLRDELKLNEVLWIYWLSETLPSYAKLSVLASSLDLLINSWYNSNNSKIKGNFLPHAEFKDLFKDELEQIKEKLETVNFEFDDFKTRLYNKIANSNQMGFNASIQFFFKEIGLKIDEIEKEAIQYRNNPVHGRITSEQELIMNEYTYKTMINRILLKILGYDWAYVDYHTIKFPLRHIDEPIGWNNNDKREYVE